MNAPIRILGIDPGYDRCGVAILEKKDGKETLLFSDCIVTNAKDSFVERLTQIGAEVETLIETWKPQVFSIENLFVTKNQKTASRVSEVRGGLIYIASNKGLSVHEFTPLEVKTTIAGYGKASKNQVSEMVKHSIHLEKEPRFDDEYDAIAVALTCLYKNINMLSTKVV